MTIPIVSTAAPIADQSPASLALAMNDPMPGSVTVVLPTVIASDATTKNQPPDIDIIVFQIKPGIAKGTSSRQKRCHPERWKLCVASSRSFGTLRIDWYRLKVMFQAWLVKIANTQASSAPNTWPGNRLRKNTNVKGRKPRIG